MGTEQIGAGRELNFSLGTILLGLGGVRNQAWLGVQTMPRESVRRGRAHPPRLSTPGWCPLRGAWGGVVQLDCPELPHGAGLCSGRWGQLGAPLTPTPDGSPPPTSPRPVPSLVQCHLTPSRKGIPDPHVFYPRAEISSRVGSPICCQGVGGPELGPLTPERGLRVAWVSSGLCCWSPGSPVQLPRP